MAKKTLHALLIGINTYAEGIRSLNGCINDLRAFRDYLQRRRHTDATLRLKTLENKKATRQAVIAGFKHFNEAQAGDVCLLFFSGHGTRIPAPDFWETSEGSNEAIVCHDQCLTDKELSCLIYQATKDKPDVHFLVVMDCCNAANNTRADDIMANVRLTDVKRYPQSINAYYGFDKGLYIKGPDGKYDAPKGQHIHFAACRNYQFAQEILYDADFRGAFTVSLIEALDTSADSLSYADLERRVGQKIENRAANQRPQVDSIVGEDKSRPFLGGAMAPKNRFFIYWNKAQKTWEINAGAYHGVRADSEIRLQEKDIPFKVVSIYPDRSSVEPNPVSRVAFEGQQQTQYDALLSNVGVGQHKVALLESDPEGAALLKAQFPKAGAAYLQLETGAENGALGVKAAAGAFALMQPGSERPMFFPVKGYNVANALDFWKRADNVLQWMHLKTLENPATSIRQDALQIKLYRGERREDWYENSPETMELVENTNEPVLFAYKPDRQTGRMTLSSFALSIQNNSDQDLFVSGLYMDGRFGALNSLLPTKRLKPKETAWFVLTRKNRSVKSIGLNINENYWKAGITEITDYIKIIAATEEFDATGFEQEPLDIQQHTSNARGIGFEIPEIEKPDWTTRLIGLHILRPQPETVVTDGNAATLNEKIRVSAPAGFRATASLANANEAGGAAGIAMPPLAPPGWRHFELTEGFYQTPGLSAIVLQNATGMAAVSPEAPLQIALIETLLSPGEVFAPFVYDADTKRLCQAGLPGDAQQPAQITALPGQGTDNQSLHFFLCKSIQSQFEKRTA